MRIGKLNARFLQPIPVSSLIASVWIPTDSRLLPTENLKSERARNVWRQINPAVRLPQRVLSRPQADPRSSRVASTVYFGRQQIAQCSDCYRFQQIVAVSIHTAVHELLGHNATGGAHKTGYILSDNHVLSLFLSPYSFPLNVRLFLVHLKLVTRRLGLWWRSVAYVLSAASPQHSTLWHVVTTTKCHCAMHCSLQHHLK